MEPADLPLNQLLSFVLSFVQPQHRRILDVGCGNGHLAARLIARSFEVVAIDEDPDSVNAASALGVPARVVRWPDFEDELFDVVIFAASLHHLQPLSKAVERARDVLRPGGLVIIDEFDWTAVDPATAEWFYRLVRVLSAAGLISTDGESFPAELARTKGEFAFWQQSHDEDLHTVPSMWAELRSAFQELSSSKSPHLFKYLVPALPNNALGHTVLTSVLEMEQGLARLGSLALIGRRFVGINSS